MTLNTPTIATWLLLRLVSGPKRESLIGDLIERYQTEYYRGNEYKTNLLRKIALEIVVNEDFLERTVETLSHVSRTGPEGNIGDGKIFIMPTELSIDIGSETRGPEAV